MPRLGCCILVLALGVLAGCGEVGEPADEMIATPEEIATAGEDPATGSAGTGDSVPVADPVAEPVAEPAPPAAAEQTLVVHRSPTCGCCLAWADQMQAAGFRVEVREVQDLAPIKQRLGVPPQSASCHTAEIGGYFVEGHVPAADIRRLLAERPDAKGLAVPGMPLGSPGMEHPSGTTQPYDVQLVRADGSTEVFATHP